MNQTERAIFLVIRQWWVAGCLQVINQGETK